MEGQLVGTENHGFHTLLGTDINSSLFFFPFYLTF